MDLYLFAGGYVASHNIRANTHTVELYEEFQVHAYIIKMVLAMYCLYTSKGKMHVISIK